MEMIKVPLITTLIVVTQTNFSLRETAVLLHSEILCRPLDALPLAVPSFLYTSSKTIRLRLRSVVRRRHHLSSPILNNHNLLLFNF